MRNLWGVVLVAVWIVGCRIPAEHFTSGTDDGGVTADAAPGDAAPDDAALLALSLELLAGDIGGPGDLDGSGAAARFQLPTKVAVDSAGNLYVADARSGTIRKITAAGDVTTLAGAAGAAGSADGMGAAARFSFPMGVTVDSAGNLYVADTGNHTIRKITTAGMVTTLAGTAGTAGSADGTGAAARFNQPGAVAVDSAGNLYVADRLNNTVRKITDTGVVTTLAGTAGSPGSADGTGAAARFSDLFGVAVDSAGDVYVADYGNNTIRKITAAGQVTTLAGTAGTAGSADGTGAAARFSNPAGVAVDAAGSVYVADFANHTIRKVTAAGVVTTLAGAARIPGSADGTGAAASFRQPFGVAVDSAGNIYVADYANYTVRKVTAAGVVTTLAGSAGVSGSADGAGAAARFNAPAGVTVDSAGNVYVADYANHTVRKITAAGVVTTLAGTPALPGSTDGTGAAARFTRPCGVAVDRAGNVYLADSSNDTLRKITAAGVVTTLAGTAGASGSIDGPGAAARFSLPFDVAVNGAGNVYVADRANNTIRKVTATGLVTTLAGTPGPPGSADGTGAAARFGSPTGVAVDDAGNVYVADHDNHTIRKVAPDGLVTTLAGTAGMVGSADGAGGAARFYLPFDVAVDGAGNVYVADLGNHAIRKVTPAGVTTTVAGTASMAGIVLGTTPRFGAPVGLAIAGDSIVVSDANAILLLRHGAR